MKLFNEEKDLIFKIANLVLIIWLLGAMTAFWLRLVDIVLPTKNPTYANYKETYCTYGYEKPYIEENVTRFPEFSEEECKKNYDNHISYLEDSRYENKKQLFVAFGNVLIVGFVIFILNRKRAK